MEGFVEKIMPCESARRTVVINYLFQPAHSVGILRDLCVGISRTSNWRKALYQPDELPLSPSVTSEADRWGILKHKVQSTMIFGPDFSALVDVLAAYEHSRNTEARNRRASLSGSYLIQF